LRVGANGSKCVLDLKNALKLLAFWFPRIIGDGGVKGAGPASRKAHAQGRIRRPVVRPGCGRGQGGNRALEGRPKAAPALEGGRISWFEVFLLVLGLAIRGWPPNWPRR
jgi:hypothetical protein